MFLKPSGRLTDAHRDPPGVRHVKLEPPLGRDVLVAGLDNAGAAGEGPGHVEAHDVHPEGGDEEEVMHESGDEDADGVRAAGGGGMDSRLFDKISSGGRASSEGDTAFVQIVRKQHGHGGGKCLDQHQPVVEAGEEEELCD